jgi:hypothetical protein
LLALTLAGLPLLLRIRIKHHSMLALMRLHGRTRRAWDLREELLTRLLMLLLRLLMGELWRWDLLLEVRRARLLLGKRHGTRRIGILALMLLRRRVGEWRCVHCGCLLLDDGLAPATYPKQPTRCDPGSIGYQLGTLSFPVQTGQTGTVLAVGPNRGDYRNGHRVTLA